MRAAHVSKRHGNEVYTSIPTSEKDAEMMASTAPADDRPKRLVNSQLAAAKAMAYLMRMEAVGYCSVEKESVYGAAVAIPQVARSAGWSTTLTGLAIRSYVFLLFNVFLQLFLLAVICEELHIMYPLAGRIHLCDFGRAVNKCPGAPDCIGPGGTDFSFKRTYSGFETWATRVFVRDALAQLFPDRVEEVAEAADPGEFGLEDYYCRLVCLLIFMMGVVEDLKSTVQLFFMLLHVPTEDGTWILYEAPEREEKEAAKAMHGWSELDLVKFKVAGVPFGWKVANVVFVCLPKLYIWWTLTSGGVHFLMETAGIVDLVVNSMALTFVLSIDEMIFSRLLTVASKHIMNNLQDLPLFDTSDVETEDEDVILKRFLEDEYGLSRWKMFCIVIPRRLMLILVLLALFVCKYYYEYCDAAEDGSLVSKPVFRPVSVPYNPLSFMYGWGLSEEESPSWRMPWRSSSVEASTSLANLGM